MNRFALALLAGLAFIPPAFAAGSGGQPAEGKQAPKPQKLTMEFAPMALRIVGADKYRMIKITLDLTAADRMTDACRRVPHFVDAVVTRLMAEPAVLAGDETIDVAPLELRLTRIAHEVIGGDAIKGVRVGEWIGNEKRNRGGAACS
ncbi:MAG: hypothetical protein HQL38_01335 [Alphaproteobacteria bacterium]|nr:hypothetical protein [Alphaproteobacteria bacterium]